MTINVFHCTVKVLIGDEDDYNIEGSHLVFGVSANSTNCVEDEEQCFSFTAVHDSIKEEEEKFKLYLSTSDSGIRFYRDQGHISILKDPADGMRVWLYINVPSASIVCSLTHSFALLILIQLMIRKMDGKMWLETYRHIIFIYLVVKKECTIIFYSTSTCQ